MAPDLNSLPSSQSTTISQLPQTQSTESPSRLPTAATIMNTNVGSRRSSSSNQNRSAPRLDRMPSDRSNLRASSGSHQYDHSELSSGDMVRDNYRHSSRSSFSTASPRNLGGRSMVSTGDPHHQRQPSLGDIHNELEHEQEAQVNRMLQMIRAQQQQLEALQLTHPSGDTRASGTQGTASNGEVIVDDFTPVSERSFSFNRVGSTPQRAPSANRSPALRPLPGHESTGNVHGGSFPPSPVHSMRRASSRDETAFYQVETANLTRENQMLKLRVRELEKQLEDLNAG